MLKVSFKDNFKKVEFDINHKETSITLTGKMKCPDFISKYLPAEVGEWVRLHPSVDVSESYIQAKLYYVIEVSGKSVCADGDIFDAKIGERIAESRAKIKLYKFMHTLCKKLMYCYYGYIYMEYQKIGEPIKLLLYQIIMGAFRMLAESIRSCGLKNQGILIHY